MKSVIAMVLVLMVAGVAHAVSERVVVAKDEVVQEFKSNSVLKTKRCRGRLFGRLTNGKVKSIDVDVVVPPMELVMVSIYDERGFVDGWSKVKCSAE